MTVGTTSVPANALDNGLARTPYLGWNTFFAHPGGGQAALLVVPGAKVVGTIVSMFFPGWRAFGAGLLSSIALGVLIFFGSCVYHFRG